MTQLDLLDTLREQRRAARTRARRTDPETSQAAAVRSEESVSLAQQEVLKLFALHGPMTDEELVNAAGRNGTKQRDSGLRTRRAELSRARLLVPYGHKQTTSGRQAIVRGLTPSSEAQAQLVAVHAMQAKLARGGR